MDAADVEIWVFLICPEIYRREPLAEDATIRPRLRRDAWAIEARNHLDRARPTIKKLVAEYAVACGKYGLGPINHPVPIAPAPLGPRMRSAQAESRSAAFVAPASPRSPVRRTRRRAICPKMMAGTAMIPAVSGPATAQARGAVASRLIRGGGGVAGCQGSLPKGPAGRRSAPSARKIARDQGLLYLQVPASVPRRRYDQNSSAANGSAAYVQTSVALPSWTCMTWTSLS
jgi:hypothetical protein